MIAALHTLRVVRPPCAAALAAFALAALTLAAAPLHAERTMPEPAPVDGRADWRPPASRRGSAPAPAAPAPAAALPQRPADPPPRALERRPPELGPLPLQRLVAGRPWRLQLRGRRGADGGRPRIEARDLPPGATLLPSGRDGWHTLDWTPSAATIGPLELTLVAVDRRDGALRSERRLRLEILEGERGRERKPMPASVPPLSTRSQATPAASVSHAPSPPRITPIPTQIVSAGRVVRLRVEARLDPAGGGGERRPRLFIDRLPRGASFDANADGSRTFRWPTGGNDQGEHRFRITALHPENGALGSIADVTVIVGDPTRGSSGPD